MDQATGERAIDSSVDLNIFGLVQYLLTNDVLMFEYNVKEVYFELFSIVSLSGLSQRNINVISFTR